MRSSCCSLFFLAVVAAIAGGCGNAPPSDAAAPAAGGAKVAEPVPTPPSWRLTGTLRIDGYASDLVPVGGIAVAPDGGIAVLQNQDHLVRFFDAAGAERGSIGGSGEGPGEFSDLMLGTGWVADTLWVYDYSQRRYSLVAPDLRFVRNVFPPARIEPDPAQAGNAEYRVSTPLGLCGNREMLAHLAPLTANAAPREGTDELVGRVDLDGVMGGMLLDYPGGDVSVTVRAGTGYSSTSIPFANRPVLAVAPDGSRVALAQAFVDGPDAGTFDVTVVSCGGDTIIDRRYGFEARPIPRQVADSAIDAQAARLQTQFPDVAAALRREAHVPALYPPLRDLLVGRDGTIWINLRDGADHQPWLVLDPAGNPIGFVVTGGAITVFVADRATIWATEADENDVESVVRYRVSSD